MAIGLLTLALVGTVALVLTLGAGYQAPGDIAAVKRHILMALGTTTLLVMAHSFIMFFLIATGVALKDVEKAQGWGDSFRRRTLVLKARAFPSMTLALLLVMANFVLGAAAHTHVLPARVHEGLAWATLASCLGALRREYLVLGENNRLIEEAATRRRALGPGEAG